MRVSLSISHLHGFDNADVFVAGSRWRVDKKKVQRSPANIGQELFHHSVLFWPSPHNRVVVVGFEQEADRHDGQPLSRLVYKHRHPTLWNEDESPIVYPQVYVEVQSFVTESG